VHDDDARDGPRESRGESDPWREIRERNGERERERNGRIRGTGGVSDPRMRADTFENSARILSVVAQISGARSVARYARRTSCGERRTVGAKIPHTHIHAFTHARTYVRTYVRYFLPCLSLSFARARYSGFEGRTFSFRACNSSSSILNASTFGSFDVTDRRQISSLPYTVYHADDRSTARVDWNMKTPMENQLSWLALFMTALYSRE
jgi:hypothetical protein